ncbi:MAG TPA: MarR family transcriptional regulator [Gammaproteobacteria bacterium]|nr:MarR family transcriptional regulator [Gammaproteobacteria bacterium]
MRTNLAFRFEPELDPERALTVRRAVTSLGARLRSERAGRLTLNETAVLGRLATRGSMTAGGVARHLGSKPQSLTRTFAALEKAGYLQRSSTQTDRRHALLAVTEAGLRALGAEMAPRDAWLGAAMQRMLTPEESDLLAVAARLLQRLADSDPGLETGEP